MRPLVAVRRATAFDPNFIRRDALFEPVVAACGRLGPLDDFPSVDALVAVFAGEPPVRFVAAEPRRRRAGCVDLSSLYDARIALAGVVPTRPRCWHDLMNALVWGTFPRAKRALHARQHRAIAERVPPGAGGLLPRSPELDALALVDEGGVLVLADDADAASRALAARKPGALASLLRSGEGEILVFGHAIYESLALGAQPAVVAAFVLGRQRGGGDAGGAVDGALEEAIADVGRFRSPRELMRVDLAEARGAGRPDAGLRS